MINIGLKWIDKWIVNELLLLNCLFFLLYLDVRVFSVLVGNWLFDMYVFVLL